MWPEFSPISGYMAPSVSNDKNFQVFQAFQVLLFTRSFLTETSERNIIGRDERLEFLIFKTYPLTVSLSLNKNEEKFINSSYFLSSISTVYFLLRSLGRQNFVKVCLSLFLTRNCSLNWKYTLKPQFFGIKNTTSILICILYMYRVSQNKYVISGDWCKILPYLCNSPAWYFKNLLLHPMAKKSAKLFFLSKSKIWKSKIVFLYHFYQILKFYKYYLNCEHDFLFTF